jgi:hypothetical protein
MTATDTTALTALYQYGILADSLRDTCRRLLDCPDVDAPTVAELAARYTALREKIATVLPDDQAGRLLDWTPERPAHGGGVAWTFYAAATLGAYVDSVFAAPAAVGAHQVRTAQIAAALREATPAAALPAQAATSSGPYL